MKRHINWNHVWGVAGCIILSGYGIVIVSFINW